jgi:hypothetical protein
MRAQTSSGRSWGAAIALFVLAFGGCGGGGPHGQLPDGGRRDGADAQDVATEEPAVEAGGADATDASPEATEPPDAALDADATLAVDGGADGGDGGNVDAAEVADRPAESAPPDAPAEKVEAGADAPVDMSIQKPPATASWTIAPNPLCTAAGAGCMDTGTVGGYQITASGNCATASSIQLWFPGGMSSVPVGTYTVVTASGILDVINMQAGKVGLLAERDDAANNHFRYWGQGGMVTVSAAGAGRRITFSTVPIREETSGATTNVGGDVTCP